MPSSSERTILDTSKALERLGGNRELYKKLLGIFLRNYSNFETSTHELIDKKNFTDLFRTFHNLTGSAGLIEATQLRKRAHELEVIFQRNELPDSQLVNEFLKLHTQTLSFIEKTQTELT